MATKREWMTMEMVLEELRVPLSTMSDWRREGRGPVFSRLLNGKLRITRDDFNAWCDSLEKV
jgi:predicted site-specific integrase-resolvase